MTEAARAVLLAAPGLRPVAALDGRRFDDLPTRLAALGAPARLLWDVEEPEALLCAARLVQGPAAAGWWPAVIDLAFADAAGVFALAPRGLPEAAVDAHFRGLDDVTLPDGREVWLHYADADVIIGLLDHAEPAEAARLIGPLAAFVLPGAPGGPPRVERAPPGIAPPPGRMAISPAQFAALDEAAHDRAHLRMAAMLAEAAPDAAAELGPAGLTARLRAATPIMERYGFATERAQLAWMALDLAAGPDFHADPSVAEWLNRRDVPPLERVQALAQASVRAGTAEAG